MDGLPGAGYVVVINVDPKRCDALVLSSAKKAPIHISLQQFSYDKAVKLRDLLKKGLLDARARKRRYTGLEEGEKGSQDDEESDDDSDKIVEPIDEETAEVENALRAIRPTQKAKPIAGPVSRTVKGLWEIVVKPILEEMRLSVRSRVLFLYNPTAEITC